MRRFAALVMVLLALPAGGCTMKPMKPRNLVHPGGVTFTGWYEPDFEICNWIRDPNNPQPCPLVIHLPAGDLGDAELSDAAALRRAGWVEQNDGSLVARAGRGRVCCHYQEGALVGVGIYGHKITADGSVAFSVGGKRVSVPATEEAITAALGQPVRRY